MVHPAVLGISEPSALHQSQMSGRPEYCVTLWVGGYFDRYIALSNPCGGTSGKLGTWQLLRALRRQIAFGLCANAEQWT